MSGCDSHRRGCGAAKEDGKARRWPQAEEGRRTGGGWRWGHLGAPLRAGAEAGDRISEVEDRMVEINEAERKKEIKK